MTGDCFEAKEIAGDVVRGEETAGRWTRVRRARRAIGESNWGILGGVMRATCPLPLGREYRDRIVAGGSGGHVIGFGVLRGWFLSSVVGAGRAASLCLSFIRGCHLTSFAPVSTFFIYFSSFEYRPTLIKSVISSLEPENLALSIHHGTLSSYGPGTSPWSPAHKQASRTPIPNTTITKLHL